MVELWIKGLACLLGVGLYFVLEESNSVKSTRAARIILPLSALFAILAYFNFGLFHRPGFIHHWEQFHYFLGSKYFRELGYDGLYVASFAAQLQQAPDIQHQSHMRDLRNNRTVATDELGSYGKEVFDRFTPERWQEFSRDNLYFLRHTSWNYFSQFRLDHGYNPSPAAALVTGAVAGRFAASHDNLVLLGLLDPLLLVVMLVAVFRTFGKKIGYWVILVAGLGYAWRFYWVGGALLRQDWLVAWVLGLCALRRRQFFRSGLFFAYASLVRIFPLVLLLGVAVVGLRDILQRRPVGWLGRLVGGFALALALGVIAGSLTGRGSRAWPEFFVNLRFHRATWLTNNVGSENLILYDGDILNQRLVDWSKAEPWETAQQKIEENRRERRVLLSSLTLLLVALLAAAAWRSDPFEAAVLGPVALFAVASATCYYWIVLLTVPLRGDRWTPPALLAISGPLYALHLFTSSFELIYGAMSWLLAVFFISWLIYIRRRPDQLPPKQSAARARRRQIPV